jgi:hypothetical protein
LRAERRRRRIGVAGVVHRQRHAPDGRASVMPAAQRRASRCDGSEDSVDAPCLPCAPLEIRATAFEHRYRQTRDLVPRSSRSERLEGRVRTRSNAAELAKAPGAGGANQAHVREQRAAFPFVLRDGGFAASPRRGPLCARKYGCRVLEAPRWGRPPPRGGLGTITEFLTRRARAAHGAARRSLARRSCPSSRRRRHRRRRGSAP